MKKCHSELEFKRKVKRRTYHVVHEGISWVDVAQIEMHLWLRLGNQPIDLKVKNSKHLETAHAFGVSFILNITISI
jgi:hypothetical protein